MDLDQGGHGFQRARTYLGPSLGWVDALVQQTSDVTQPGVYNVQPGDSLLLVEVAASVTVQLPDVNDWVKQSDGQPATGFERSITVKDQGGNAGNFPITIAPHAGQAIDNVFAPVQVSVARSSIRLYPLIDLTGWYVESSAVGGPPANGDVFKAGNNDFTGTNNFLGTITVPVLIAGDDSNKAASTSFVKAQGFVVTSQLNAYATKESPALTGTPTAPTPGNAVNDGTIATTAFVKSNLAGYQPLDDDLTSISGLTGVSVMYYRSGVGVWTAVTIGANMSFVGGVLSSTAAGGSGDVTQAGNNTFTGTNAFNGSLTAVTVPAATNTTAVATTAFVKNQNYVTTTTLSLYAPLGSPIFTGNPTAPTPSTGDNSTSVATTAYVKNNLNNYQPLDADLTAIASLTGTNTIYYRSAADTWSPVVVGANLTFAGGILSGTASGGTVNSSGGGYSTSTLTGYNDATGNVIRAITTGNGISIAAGQLTLDPDLQALAALTATNAIYYRSAADTWNSVTIGSGLIFSGGTLSASASGGGNVSNTGTPTAGQYPRWTSATVIEGVTPATVRTDIGAQPLDGDLTAIAALTGTNTIYYRSATDTWSPVVIGANLTFAGGTLNGPPAGGNVSNTGTPVNNQVAVWTDATHVEGDPKLTWDGTSLQVISTDGVAIQGAAGQGMISVQGATADAGLLISSKGNSSVTMYNANFGRVCAQFNSAPGSNTFPIFTAGVGSSSVGNAPAGNPINFASVVSLITGSTGVTQSAGDNSTKLATTAYVEAAVAAGAGGGAWTTGDVKLTFKTVADSGWILMNDTTMGDVGSGASNVSAANQALFILLYNNINDTGCPILTSAGGATNRATQGTAATAWANKVRLTLPRTLGRALAGAGNGAGLTARPIGNHAGAEVDGNFITHNHALSDPGHVHAFQGYSGLVSASYVTVNGGSSYNVCQWGGSIGTTSGANAGLSVNNAGAVGSTNSVQPTQFLNVMIKL